MMFLAFVFVYMAGILTQSATSTNSVQPFFLSALSSALTPEQAEYIGRFPLAVINHKQSLYEPPSSGAEEAKQVTAIQMIKAANSSCQTHFYLNSLIDFSQLALHQKFVKNPSWWLKADDGTPITHGSDNIFDWSQPGARDAWVATATEALSHDAVDGVFVDKATFNASFRGVSASHVDLWNKGHLSLLLALRASTSKNIVLNNEYVFPSDKMAGMGQLFERFGASPADHDGLTISQDMQLLSKLNKFNLTALARAGGATPSTNHGKDPDPVACGAGLAEFLITLTNPKSAFFSCQTTFASSNSTGWMTLLSDPIYSHPLGTPVGDAVVGPTGLVHRNYSSGTVAWLQPNASQAGCVQWANKEVSGTCPSGVPPQQ